VCILHFFQSSPPLIYSGQPSRARLRCSVPMLKYI
jgi:hypothetical protein